MNKRISSTISVCLLLLSALCTPGCLFPQSNDLREEISSPDNTYKVIIERNKNDQRNFVTLKAIFLKTGAEYPEHSPIHYEGAFDSLFEQENPDRLWLSDNVFFLGYKPYLDKPNCTIVIKNESKKNIRRIRLRTDNRYFIYEINAGKSIEIPVFWAPVKGRNEIDVVVNVDFSDGTILPAKYESLPFPDLSKPVIIPVSITDSESLVGKP